MALFCLFGDKEDLLCRDLARALRGHGCSARVFDDFLGSSTKLVWMLETEQSSSTCWQNEEKQILEKDIAGVLLRKPPITPSDRWAAESEIYRQAEKESALLGWIWSLDCSVINRYRPEFWFEPTESLDFWRGRLESSGLEAAELAAPLEQGNAVANRNETQPDVLPNKDTRVEIPQSHLVAVIGSRVIWNQGAPDRLGYINDALMRFARSLGLNYLECRITDSIGKPRVAKVEPFPKYDEFCLSSRQEIVNELTFLLIGADDVAPVRTGSDSWF